MEVNGRNSPSVVASIHFRASENEEKTLEIIRNLQLENRQKIESGTIIKHEIINEKGAAFVSIKSNIWIRPIKLLIDTGATISLISEKLINKNIYVKDYIVNLFGIVGKDVSIKTEGMVYSSFTLGDRTLGTVLHLVNEKYSGPADGYLGYDFLHSYI